MPRRESIGPTPRHRRACRSQATARWPGVAAPPSGGDGDAGDAAGPSTGAAGCLAPHPPSASRSGSIMLRLAGRHQRVARAPPPAGGPPIHGRSRLRAGSVGEDQPPVAAERQGSENVPLHRLAHRRAPEHHGLHREQLAPGVELGGESGASVARSNRMVSCGSQARQACDFATSAAVLYARHVARGAINAFASLRGWRIQPLTDTGPAPISMRSPPVTLLTVYVDFRYWFSLRCVCRNGLAGSLIFAQPGREKAGLVGWLVLASFWAIEARDCAVPFRALHVRGFGTGLSEHEMSGVFFIRIVQACGFPIENDLAAVHDREGVGELAAKSKYCSTSTMAILPRVRKRQSPGRYP